MGKQLALVTVLAFMLSLAARPTAAQAVSCAQTGFFQDGINLTAARIGGAVTGDLDATGCNVGVFYGAGTTGSVQSATIHGASYYGVLVRSAKVDITNSVVHTIGETPFNGAQHGVGILYRDGAAGTITGNNVHHYQKGGIVVKSAGTSATVSGNTATGLGPVPFIAQNGIQISGGAVADVRGNTISDNFYTGLVGVGPNAGGQNPPGWVYFSTGLLLFEAGIGTLAADNHFSGNQHNVAVVP